MRPFAFVRSLLHLAALGLSLMAMGCASLPDPVELPRSVAFERPASSRLGQQVQAAAPNPYYSGVRLLASGEDAFETLLALAQQADHTLDLQYYLIANDPSTRTLLRAVHAAAQRGVRVRLLLDDLNTAENDASLLCLTRHPRIEVRLYNPFPAGRLSTATRILASLTDIRRINHRMHNKLFVADNSLGVTGGRNLGDAYFVQSPDSNFVDLDVLAVGPVVRSLSNTFDRFWNSLLAYPVSVLVQQEPRCDGALDAPRPNADAPAVEATVAPAPAPAPASAIDPARLRWVPATVLADAPSKIASEGQPDASETIADDLGALVRTAASELVVISPYFVPGTQGVALVRELRERGVKVRVLTNSLASTDAPAVHIGYARYRPDLLRAGVELHELRPRLGATRAWLGRFGSSAASLHAKALVIDRRTVLVGSMNMDPRSARLNTEVGLVLRSPALAAEVMRLYEDVARSSSYRLELVEPDGERLRWRSDTPGVPSVEGREPGASVGAQLLLMLLTPFAPEELL